MLLNVALLIVVFAAVQKNFNPYLAALLLGAAKAVVYSMDQGNIPIGVCVGVVYGLLAAAFVWVLDHLNKREKKEGHRGPAYRAPGTEKLTFRWEYFLLVVLLVLIVGGQALEKRLL